MNMYKHTNVLFSQITPLQCTDVKKNNQCKEALIFFKLQDGESQEKKQEKPKIPSAAPAPMPDDVDSTVLQATETTEKSQVSENT